MNQPTNFLSGSQFVFPGLPLQWARIRANWCSDNLDASKRSNTYIHSYECVHRDLQMFRRSSKQNDVGYGQDFDC